MLNHSLHQIKLIRLTQPPSCYRCLNLAPFGVVRGGHLKWVRNVGRGHRRVIARGISRRTRLSLRLVEKGTTMLLILWIIAAILVISGIVSLVRGQLLMGAALIVVGLLVGPGGVSIFT